MKISMKIYTLAVCLLTIAVSAGAQNKKSESVTNPHSIRITYSDGSTLADAGVFGIGLADAIMGTKRSDEKVTGVFGIGYRYAFGRKFRAGMDVGFAKITSKVTYSPDKMPSVKEKELELLVLPTAEYLYFKRGLFELYGSLAAGINFTRHYENGITPKGKEMAQKKSSFENELAYQVNPLGLRVGNDRIGGFVEAGLGYRGFVTAGISMNF